MATRDPFVWENFPPILLDGVKCKMCPPWGVAAIQPMISGYHAVDPENGQMSYLFSHSRVAIY